MTYYFKMNMLYSLTNGNISRNDEFTRYISIKMHEYTRMYRTLLRSQTDFLANKTERRELTEEQASNFKATTFLPKSEKRHSKSDTPYSQGNLIELCQNSSQVAEQKCKTQEEAAACP